MTKDPAIQPRLVETLAKSKDVLAVSGAPEGFDAAAVGEAALLRSGVSV